MKKELKEKLKGLEAIEKNQPAFWELQPQQREIYFELNEPDFQKIINLLEAKGLYENEKAIGRSLPSLYLNCKA